MNDPFQTVDEPERQPAAPVPAESTPQQIGRYRVERVLGRGGFGLVYLAHDDQLQRLVAIKVPHRERVRTPEDAQAYLLEARTVAKLDHPNIVPVHDVGSPEPAEWLLRLAELRLLAAQWKIASIHLEKSAEVGSGATDVVFGYRNPRRIRALAARNKGRVRVVDDASAYFRPTGEELEPLALYATLKSLMNRDSEQVQRDSR